MSVVLQKHQPPPPRLKGSTTPVHLNVEFTIFMGGIGKKLSIKNWVLCDIARICFPEFRQQPSCSLGYSLLWNITRQHECLDEGAHAIALDAFRQQISWLVTRMIYVYTYIYICVCVCIYIYVVKYQFPTSCRFVSRYCPSDIAIPKFRRIPFVYVRH